MANLSRALPSFALISLIATLVSGCATFQPEALRDTEINETLKTDREVIFKDVQAFSGTLKLEEAIARAIKYNAERRLRDMEEAVAQGTLDAGNFDMLPKLVASAGYRDRDSNLISRSKDSVTGLPSLANPYISSSRYATTTDLTFSWSLLDFGQSYFAAKQNADRVFIAAERKRKALHILIQDVRAAYWKVLAAQRLSMALRTTIREAEAALDNARSVEAEGQRSPLEPLRYQRQVLENLRLLESIEQELSTARVELAFLTNLPRFTVFQVEEPALAINTKWLDMPVEQLEEHALLRNPDVREGIYNGRIAREETRRVLLKLFPGISFNYGKKTSDDPYLINQHWTETGVQISLNLFGLFAAPAQMNLAEAGVALADQKRMATQLTVLSQLHIARLQYANAVKAFNRADAIADVDAKMTTHVANQVMAEKQSKTEHIAQQAANILSQLRRIQALSNAQAAASRLQATLGFEPVASTPAKVSLGELTTLVSQALKTWDSGTLPALPAITPPAKPE